MEAEASQASFVLAAVTKRVAAASVHAELHNACGCAPLSFTDFAFAFLQFRLCANARQANESEEVPGTDPVCWGASSFNGGSAAPLQLDLLSQTNVEPEGQGYRRNSGRAKSTLINNAILGGLV